MRITRTYIKKVSLLYKQIFPLKGGGCIYNCWTSGTSEGSTPFL